MCYRGFLVDKGAGGPAGVTSEKANTASQLAGGLGNDTLNGVFRDDAFNQQVGPDLEIGGQRPAPRPAPVSATSKSEESVAPSFKPPQVDTEDIDELFEGSLLPELLERQSRRDRSHSVINMVARVFTF